MSANENITVIGPFRCVFKPTFPSERPIDGFPMVDVSPAALWMMGSYSYLLTLDDPVKKIIQAYCKR